MAFSADASGSLSVHARSTAGITYDIPDVPGVTVDLTGIAVAVGLDAGSAATGTLAVERYGD